MSNFSYICVIIYPFSNFPFQVFFIQPCGCFLCIAFILRCLNKLWRLNRKYGYSICILCCLSGLTLPELCHYFTPIVEKPKKKPQLYKYMKKSRAGKFQSINHSAKISQTVQKERLCIIITKRFSNSGQKKQPRLNIKN
jgi:hypothetical protein